MSEPGPPAVVSVTLPAQVDSLALARSAVREYVRAHTDDDALVYAVQLAASEVLAALLELSSDELELGVELVAGHVEVTVGGHAGGVRLPENELRTRLVEAVTDDVAISFDAAAEQLAVRIVFPAVPV